MRKQQTQKGLTVNVVAGTHVVLLGMDLANTQRKGCLGFAIQREDRTEDERYWMSGMKTFKDTDEGLGLGGQVSSRVHPFQSFQWADYSAKPEHDYTYTVVPMYGTPKQLEEGDAVSIRIATEKEFGGPHSVFFNRGAVASQEYARRFQNKDPDEIGEAAYRWLSRGLLEAFVTFVGRAINDKCGLFGAFYEFQWPAALSALKEAAARGAKVQIVYDGLKSGSGPRKKNEEAIKAAKVVSLCKPRTTGRMMHNKFLVLTRNDKPVAVWTGSTNLTENGIFGHSNCGHLVENAEVARAYFDYWNELRSNPESATERTWVADNNPNPPKPWSDDLCSVFSPRKGLAVLEWYAAIAGSAKKPLFMTFAFGMHKDFQEVSRRTESSDSHSWKRKVTARDSPRERKTSGEFAHCPTSSSPWATTLSRTALIDGSARNGS